MSILERMKKIYNEWLADEGVAKERALVNFMDDEIGGVFYSLPEFEVINKRAWDQFNENSNACEFFLNIVNYANRWANLMEARMARGCKLQDIAQVTSLEADFGDITGGAFAFAVQELAGCWKHGKDLRIWYCNRY